MKFHDYSLEEYSVRIHGALISLHLLRDTESSEIEFSEVILYHFIHTGGAIITEIMEVPVGRMVDGKKDLISEWSRMHGGIQHWNGDHASFISKISSLGYRAWSVESAIGFEAFIIGKEIKQK